MAELVARQDGNFTTAATWGVVAHSGGGFTNSTNTTTSYVYCPTFTIANATVVDGIVMLLRRLGTTGTLSVALSDDNGTTATREVTVNASDISSTTSSVWVYFQFGSTLTGDGGSDYRVGVKTSTSAQAAFLRSSTTADWARRVVGTATGTPAGGDFMFVLGKRTAAATFTTYTVTMNETAATSYNGVNVSDKGVLTWDTSQSTTLRTGSANTNGLFVGAGGIVNIGTSGTPIPRAFNAVCEFANTSDGAVGLLVQSEGTLTAYGQSRTSGKNIVACKLNGDEAAAQTVLSVDTDTGWKSGDEIAISATSQTATQHERRFLANDAGATTMEVTAGLTNAHSGTAPTQAEVVLLTRNVKIRSTSSTNMMYLTVEAGGSFSGEWFEVQYSGSSAANNKNSAIRIESTTASTFRYACCYDGEAYGFAMVGVQAFDWRDLVAYAVARSLNNSAGVYIASGCQNYTFQDVYIIGGGVATTHGIRVLDLRGATFKNIYITSNSFGTAAGTALWFESDHSTIQYATLENINIHSNTFGTADSGGIGFFTSAVGITFKNLNIWRNVGIGFISEDGILADFAFEDCKIFGNSITGMYFLGRCNAHRWRMKNVLFAGDSSVAQPRGIYVNCNNGMTASDWEMESCTFGVATGIYVAHTTGDLIFLGTIPNSYVQWRLSNSVLASGSPITGFTPTSGGTYGGLTYGSYIASMQHGQAVDHRVFTPHGNLAYETTTFDVSPSLKMTPAHATLKLTSNALMRGRGYMVLVSTSHARTVSVKVRKDGSYNGNQPRLILKANPAVGITADEVLDTMSVGANTWETLQGTTSTATAVGVLEFIVDCDGTAGNVFVDTWRLVS